ncbi:hypothetical protein [Streptococcus moroccensis]|uniref:Uncharacterized protein n=1 Tax=Streptococcus moroccensis TaxID=1451356 RepID=A0ABT9YRB4_9STRE|nr:hypothetical protein [Streptococcus moroccensis]MDQ0222141.1 hypothetical protein [Streptococcus moroccensis]
MARVVYVQEKASHAGCGCLASILLLWLVFLKSFWRPLLVVFLVLFIWHWLKQTIFKKHQQDFYQISSPYAQDTIRTVKEAEGIDGDEKIK